ASSVLIRTFVLFCGRGEPMVGPPVSGVVGLSGRGRDQAAERGDGALRGVTVVEQAVGEAETEADRVQLERELLDVQVATKLFLCFGLGGDSRDAVQPRGLLLREIVAQLTGLVVELERRCEQRAAARLVI